MLISKCLFSVHNTDSIVLYVENVIPEFPVGKILPESPLLSFEMYPHAFVLYQTCIE